MVTKSELVDAINRGHGVVPFVTLDGGKKKRGRKSKAQKGAGVIDSIASVGSKVLPILKDTKIISSGLGLINDPRAKIASDVFRAIGLGKKKSKAKPKQMKGAGIFSDLGMGIGGSLAGLGAGLGSFSHGLFGGKKPKRKIHM